MPIVTVRMCSHVRDQRLLRDGFEAADWANKPHENIAMHASKVELQALKSCKSLAAHWAIDHSGVTDAQPHGNTLLA
jgi:hypothetical protein